MKTRTFICIGIIFSFITAFSNFDVVVLEISKAY